MGKPSEIDWVNQPWHLFNSEIAILVGRTKSTVREQRVKLGIPPASKKREQNKPKDRVCNYCGTIFQRRQEGKNPAQHGYCSPTCGHKAKNENRWKEEPFPEYMARISPVCRPDENNKCANNWSIQSPFGEVFQFRNLMLFLRQHTDLFDEHDLKLNNHSTCNAHSGISSLRPTNSRKRDQWKGWTWH